MLLYLQGYSLDVKYKQGFKMYIADFLFYLTKGTHSAVETTEE